MGNDVKKENGSKAENESSSKSNYIERPRYTCALGGAMATITALPRTVPILHAAPGCAGNATWTQNGGSGLQLGGYCGGLSVPSSNAQEKEVVFGGVSRLKEQIETTIDIIDADLYFIITGCVTEVIGDDVGSIVDEFEDSETDIIYAETAGFKGNSYVGYDLVLQSLFKNYLKKDNKKIKKRVNVWGVTPYMDVFWRGNLEGIRNILEKLGLEVNTFFTQKDSLEKIKDASSAELNIVVSDAYGIGAAKIFKQVHGTPYISVPLPVGAALTENFIKEVGKALNLDLSFTQSIIENENKVFYSYIETLIDCYNDLDLQKYAVIISDANYGGALPRFLSDDLGWLPELVVITDQLQEDQKELLVNRNRDFESGLQPKVVFDTNTTEVINYFNNLKARDNGDKYYDPLSPAFVVGSSLDREFALNIGAPHLSISFPVSNRAVLDRGYTGYSGGLRLIEDLLSAAVAAR